MHTLAIFTALLGAGVAMPANGVQALMRQAGRIGDVTKRFAFANLP